MRWPSWFPYPTAWLKAIILYGFLRLAGRLLNFAENFTYGLVRLAESPIVILYILLAILSPIALIAVTHNLIHQVITNRFPSIQSPMVKKYPLFMSWWEGLYGWLVIAISTLITLVVAFFATGFADSSWTSPDLEVLLGVSWLIVSAGLYQSEYFAFYRAAIANLSETK